MGDGLRERKKRKTRRRLEEVALRLFETKGYRATSVEEIAEAAEVSPSTFFRYFGSKDEVLFGVEREYREQLRAAVAEPGAGDGPDFGMLTEALVRFAGHLDGRREELAAIARIAAGEPELSSRWHELQAEWETTLATELARKKGESVPDLRVRLLAAAAHGAFAVALDSWRRNGGEEALAEIARRALAEMPGVMQDGPGPRPRRRAPEVRQAGGRAPRGGH